MEKELRDKFLNEISDFTLQQVTERLSEMDIEVRDAKDVDTVNELKEKKEMLLERKAELEDLEARKKAALELENGASGAKRERGGKEMPEEREFTIESKEYREAFMKKLMGRELDAEERAAMSASAAIPTETLNLIITRLQENPLLRRITMLNIPGHVSIPREDNVNDANWIDMPAASTDSEDSIGSLELAAHKLIKTVEIGADVEHMSIPEFEAWLVRRLANKMDAALQRGVVCGTGLKQARGITVGDSVKAEQKSTYTEDAMTFKDVMKIMGNLPGRFHKNSSWSMPSKTFFNEVLGMVDANKRPIVVTDPAVGSGYRLMGRPVDLVDDEKAIIFGDFSYYYMNLAAAIEIKADGSVGFRTGSVCYRAMALADGGVADDEAFAIATPA